MEPMKISKTHWSYRLISFAFGVSSTEEWIRYYNVDSCRYNRKVFWASVLVMVATLFALWYGAAVTVSTVLVALTALNTSVPWIDILRFVSDDLRDTFGIVWTIQFILICMSVAIPLLLTVVLVFIWAIDKGRNWVNRNKPKHQPSKTKELYTAWKEKYCVPVEFE